MFPSQGRGPLGSASLVYLCNCPLKKGQKNFCQTVHVLGLLFLWLLYFQIKCIRNNNVLKNTKWKHGVKYIRSWEVFFSFIIFVEWTHKLIVNISILFFDSTVHTVTLFLNIFGCLAWFCVDATRGVDFGLSILWFLLFTPCSFVCWYRPLYGAFR